MLVLDAAGQAAGGGGDRQPPARTLFFVRTKHGADRLARQLTKAGVAAEAIHGNRNQSQRQRALDAFAAGHPRVLVATDVAARGIHVDDVELVVHFDPPNDHKDYLHRSGRTARAGASGLVVTLAEEGQVRELQRMHDAAGVSAPRHHVGVGHHLVREIATTGTPVPPRAARLGRAGAGGVAPSGGGRVPVTRPATGRTRPAGAARPGAASTGSQRGAAHADRGPAARDRGRSRPAARLAADWVALGRLGG